MNKFRVNKGLQKEIRFVGLNYNYAMQYFGAVTFTWLFLFITIGMTAFLLLFYALPVVLYHRYFKARDKRNQKQNLRKLKANKLKPSQFKREFSTIIENEELLIK